ncbi:LysE family transporter, partial [Xanthomonas citri pv. citri]
MNISTFFMGMSVCFSLILAIGAQNAFVLKQGLKQQFVFIVCLICALSDAVLITG